MSKPIYADLGSVVAVGFGGAVLTRDGVIVRDGEKIAQKARTNQQCLTVRKCERMAKKDPEHEWRIVLNAPLWEATFERQGPDKWLRIHSGPGFA